MTTAVAVPRLVLPAGDALAVGARGGVLLGQDGDLATLDWPAVAARLDGPPLLVCHARSINRRAGHSGWLAAFDVLELFAFVHPARFCRPTPAGLAEALDLPPPSSLEDAAALLPRAAERLLRTLAAPDRQEASDPVAIAAAMGRGGWPWAHFVLRALGVGDGGPSGNQGLAVWRRMPEWQAEAPPGSPGSHPVEADEARQRLAELRGAGAEERPQQSDYASAVALAFRPRPAPDAPTMVIAEAGTGVGKTLGYLAPATLWAERNKAPVWISTYTRNLQHQIDQELDRLYPTLAVKTRRVVLRKGRENYLCLLNLEEAVLGLPLRPQDGAALGLMARWAAATRDGDMTGGDFPGWLPDLIGRGRSVMLADRRGECVYSACQHYGRCLVERSVRRARKADIVVANHALVMTQAAMGGPEDGSLPQRYVFDEGHHLFDAADSTFASHLTAVETADLRRWLIGAETRSGRSRGLKRRLDGLLDSEPEAMAALDAALDAARALPAEAWSTRLTSGHPLGPAEAFLTLVRTQVYARADGRDGPYGLETEAIEPIAGLGPAAAVLDAALARIEEPLLTLRRAILARLDRESEGLDPSARQRLDAIARSLDRRARQMLAGWRAMLQELGKPTPAEFVDWFGIERSDGRDFDVGFYRHWVDPTVPFAAVIAKPAHGMVVTSATLTDGTGEVERDWAAAEARTGARHLPRAAIRAQVPSPFDYGRQTRVLVVRDVRKEAVDQVAAAYRELFLASGGGALGLFTAVARLRAVHERIAAPLEAAGLAVYAQHVDGMDTATLVDIFRGEANACLLGTDAIRDGVDVPGRALRLIVFDRVPWPRPTILHRARREAHGPGHDDMITRLRLKQAFGRLIRRADDTGVFVLLDSAMPTRLAGAFPPGVEVRRVGLAEAIVVTREFLTI